MNILLLDNYDSFTYNIAHILRAEGNRITLDIVRNDRITLDEIEHYDKIVLSPGPGIPEEAGIMPTLLRRYAPHKPILGVCLGHQAIGEAFGGRLRNLSKVYHGIATPVSQTQHDYVFEGVPATLNAGRYHSWIVDKTNFPEELEITATDTEGHIMALRHRIFDVRGVQFHPESVLTEHGARMIRNWLYH